MMKGFREFEQEGLERAAGIEPASSAWKAEVIAIIRCPRIDKTGSICHINDKRKVFFDQLVAQCVNNSQIAYKAFDLLLLKSWRRALLKLNRAEFSSVLTFYCFSNLNTWHSWSRLNVEMIQFFPVAINEGR